MKPRLPVNLSCLFSIGLAASLLCSAAWPLDQGAPAPELRLPGPKGTVDLADLRGKVVYVDFWASWCAPCKQSFAFMNELQARHAAQGFEIVAVNLDARRGDADAFLAQVPASFGVAFDPSGDSARRFQVKGMPSSYVVGRDGRVVASHRGFRDEDRPAVEASVVKALAAK